MNTDLTKAILYVYPMMQKLAEATRVGARNKAILSYRSKLGTMRDVEAVADELLLANRLDELKEVVDSLLQRLSTEERFLLEYRYFRRKKVLAEFGEELACSERNYFRKQEKLLQKMTALLGANSMTEEYLLEAFENCACLMKVYRAIASGNEFKICARRKERPISFQGSKFSGGADFLPRATNTATTSTRAADSVIKTIWTADSPPAFFPPTAFVSGLGR